MVTASDAQRSQQVPARDRLQAVASIESSCARRARPRPRCARRPPQRRQQVENGIVGQPIETNFPSRRWHQPGAPHVLQVLRGVGDRQAGAVGQNLDAAFALRQLLQQIRRWVCASAFATAANWANSASFGLQLDIRSDQRYLIQLND